jgi:predicted nuclease of restriction endonuclease-like RecB superfamily
MLTADLSMSWQRGDRIRPRYIDAEDEEYLRAAEDLIALFESHDGRARALLEESLQEYVGTGTDYRTLRGLIKLLTDRCEFETSAPAEPAEIRRALFLKARERHPVASTEARAELVAEAARELSCGAEALLDGLYADLPENQRLTLFEPIKPAELLDLYNVAQAQALLYRSVEMRLWLEPQSPEGFRELFGSIKAYRLIHTVRGNSREGYEVRLDGPASIFQRSQKYGIQMAVFLPALLLCKGWRMRAEIQTKPGRVVYYELTSEQTQLRSHYPGITAYENPVTDRLAGAWTRAATAWELEPSSEVIDLGDSAFIPDFVLRHTETGARVFLEVLGFWTPEHLRDRLLEFDHAHVRHFILAAWDDLRGTREPMTNVPPNTIVFKRSLDPAAVVLMADDLARKSREGAEPPPQSVS